MQNRNARLDSAIQNEDKNLNYCVNYEIDVMARRQEKKRLRTDQFRLEQTTKNTTTTKVC